MAVTFPSNPVNGQTFTVKNVTYTYSGGTWSTQTAATLASTGPSTSEYTYTAANNQTSFSGADNYGQTMSYTAGQIGVFLNGVRLVANTDYTATNGTTVTLTEGTSANDILAVQNTVDISNDLVDYWPSANVISYVSDNSGGGGLLWDGVTNFYSNTTPAVDTNPSANGALWVDNTTGAIYICTDNTTGNNVWTVTSSLATTVQPTPPASFQGSNYGYTSGGKPTTNIIDKFSFLSDANATDVGDLTQGRYGCAGQSSSDYGYTTAGRPDVNIIDKFPFTTDSDATDVGDLTAAMRYVAGQSSSDYGYNSGGLGGTGGIDKFPFATDADATDVADLSVVRSYPAGQSSTDYGYTSGGWLPGYTNVIDKFPFATDADATDVGDLTLARYGPAGQSSTGYGYSSGGNPISNVIDKFSFSSDGDATDVGDLTDDRYMATGQSSTGYGYSSGGQSPGYSNVIDKFPFASDANATDVGDLTSARDYPAGQQY